MASKSRADITAIGALRETRHILDTNVESDPTFRLEGSDNWWQRCIESHIPTLGCVFTVAARHSGL